MPEPRDLTWELYSTGERKTCVLSLVPSSIPLAPRTAWRLGLASAVWRTSACPACWPEPGTHATCSQERQRKMHKTVASNSTTNSAWTVHLGRATQVHHGWKTYLKIKINFIYYTYKHFRFFILNNMLKGRISTIKLVFVFFIVHSPDSKKKLTTFYYIYIQTQLC